MQWSGIGPYIPSRVAVWWSGGVACADRGEIVMLSVRSLYCKYCIQINTNFFYFIIKGNIGNCDK